jgi:hypothetical protein
LFIRANAMSGAPIISGICQFANPTNTGMIAPKIMMSPCSDVSWLKNSGWTICSPGSNSSARMIIAPSPPTKKFISANSMYIVPMSLWLVVVTHRMNPDGGP